jgi:hypothetical protein
VPCTWQALRPAITGSQGAAGSTYVTITYTNVGHRACSVKGFPTVAFVDRHGRQMGATAVPTGGPARLVILGPGGKAKFVLREVHAGIQKGCTRRGTYAPAAALRITAPGTTHPYFVRVTKTDACLSRSVQQLSVFPIPR